MSGSIYLGPGNVLHNISEPTGPEGFWEHIFFDGGFPALVQPPYNPTTSKLQIMNLSRRDLAAALERATEWLVHILFSQYNDHLVAHELVDRWHWVQKQPDSFRGLPVAVLRNKLVDCWNDMLRASREYLLR